MKKFVFVAGLAIGYVLGARAGRKAYDRIEAAAQGLWRSQPVQTGVEKVQDSAKVLSEKAGDAALDGVKTLTNKLIDGQKSAARKGGLTPPATQTPREASTR